MIEWNDTAIVLGRRRQGVSGAIISLHCAHHGRVAGFVHGIRSPRTRSLWLTGNAVSVIGRTRSLEMLGDLEGSLDACPAADLVDHPARQAAIAAACAMVHAATPERQPDEVLHRSLARFLLEDIFKPDWRSHYARWEAALSATIGYGQPNAAGLPSIETDLTPAEARSAISTSGQHLAEKALGSPRARLPALRIIFGHVISADPRPSQPALAEAG